MLALNTTTRMNRHLDCKIKQRHLDWKIHKQTNNLQGNPAHTYLIFFSSEDIKQLGKVRIQLILYALVMSVQ